MAHADVTGLLAKTIACILVSRTSKITLFEIIGREVLLSLASGIFRIISGGRLSFRWISIVGRRRFLPYWKNH